MMDEKAKAARRAYKRAWAQRNPDKVQQYQEAYWSRRAAEIERQRPDQARRSDQRPSGETR